MKCTDCGAEIKPVVAIDIDGTLADYHGHFLAFADAYLGGRRQSIESLRRYNYSNVYDGLIGFRDWFCLAYNVDRSVWHEIKLAYRQGAQKRFQPLLEPETDHYTWAKTIREYGAELWVTTTRPYLSLDRVDKDTRWWLERHGIEFDGLLYDDDKYRVLAERVDHNRVVAVLDDLPEMLSEAARLFGEDATIMRNSHYNNARSWPNSTWELHEALGMIHYRIDQWRKKHGHS